MALDSIVEFVYNQLDRIHCARIRNFYRNMGISTLIDVGSHKGEFINLTAALGFDVVYAFEPQPSAMKILKENTRHIIGEIKYFNHALGASGASTIFYENKLSSTSSFLKPKTNSTWIKFKQFVLGGGSLISDSYNVDVKTLDEVFCDESEGDDLEGNTLLKVDVEGYEYNVIEGAKKLLASGNIKFIQLERARYQIYDKLEEDLEGLLEKSGYKLAAKFTYPTLSFCDEVYALSGLNGGGGNV